MRTRRWSLPAVIAAALLLASGAGAQPRPASDLAEAKRHFELGKTLYGEHATAEALAEFELSYKLAARPAARKNIAQCQRDLKQFAAAYTTYKGYLAEFGAQLSAADKATVQRALDELAVLTAELTIRSSEAGAEVTLDGRPAGRTPLDGPSRVGLGSHRLRVVKGGFEPFDQEISLQSEEKRELEVRLAREVTTGHLAVREANGRDVHLFIDGADGGPLPFVGDLPPGEHTLEARGPKHAADKRIITVVRREKLDLVLDAAPLLGHLRVAATPAAAHIGVDGVDHGTGVWEADLAPGVHNVVVTLEGYPAVVRELDLARGATLVVEIPLAAPMSAGRPEPVYRGVYGGFGFLFDVSAGAFLGNAYQLPAGAPPLSNALHFSSPPFAGGAKVNVGYAFDWWGIEFSGMFAATYDASRFTPASVSGNIELERLSYLGILGAGARATSKHESVRVTLGVAPGVAIRAINFTRSLNDSSGLSSNPSFSAGTTYVAPALLLDAAVMFGRSPGTKFFLGVNAWADFPPARTVGPDTGGAPSAGGYFDAPNQMWKVTYGPDFYVGPTLGFRFGH